MVSRSQEVSTDSEERLHDPVHRREPLELSGRREPPHLALPLSGRLMGDLRAVIRVLIGAVKHRRHHRATGGRVTAQRVGDQASRHVPLVLQQLAKEAYRGVPISSRLHEDVEDVTGLIHGTAHSSHRFRVSGPTLLGQSTTVYQSARAARAPVPLGAAGPAPSS